MSVSLGIVPSQPTTEANSNPRGIPKAPFIETVENFIQPSQAEETLQKFQEMISKFRFMENHLLQRQKSLSEKIPEIMETNETVSFLLKQKTDLSEKPIDVQFELNETLWVNATVNSPDSVCLWLGANVMLEYPTQEASDLLTSKLKSAKISLSQVKEDLEYLREQITVMEVNIARVYNYDVKNRREGKITKK